MIDNNQKAKEVAFTLLQDIDLASYSKECIKSLTTFLELDEAKVYQKNAIAEKIVQIYQNYRSEYYHYLNQPKFKTLNGDAKDFMWTILKQYEERLNQRKFSQSNQNKQMHSRQSMSSHMMPPPSQNMNMNMVNMFLEVPNFQSVEDIQVFQRKMFEIYKNFMPQVLGSLSMSRNQNEYYRNNPYQQYNVNSMTSLNNIGGMTPMSSTMGGISSMRPMSDMNIGMGGGVSSMSGIGGNSGMGNIPSMGNINNMSNMNSMGAMGNMGYMQKQNEYYQPSSFSNKYYFDNKMQVNYNPSAQPNQGKNMMNYGDYRPGSMNSQSPMQGSGFNYFNQKNSDDYRSAFKGIGTFTQNKINPSEASQFQRKSAFSQKIVNANIDDQKLDSFSPYNNESMNFSEKLLAKNRQKQFRSDYYNSQLPISHEPRKMVKRDDDLSSYNQEDIFKPEVIVCICNQKKDQQVCFYCKIVKIDPFNEVDQIIKIQKITPDKNQVSLTINQKILQRIHKSPERLDIQLRCIRMQKQFQNQICWPQRYRLSIDDQVIEDYTQSQSGSMLKKRKDKPFIFIKTFGNQKNNEQKAQVLIEIRKPSDKGNAAQLNYLFGAFVVVKHSIQKMYQKIIQQIPQKNISQFFKTSSLENTQTISVSPLEPSTKKLIKDPVRGQFCTHPQCFDLEVYLSFLAISPNRQWKCPICSKYARKLVIDMDLKKILSDIHKMVKEPKEIIIYSNGAHTLNYDQSTSQKQKQTQKQKQREGKPTVKQDGNTTKGVGLSEVSSIDTKKQAPEVAQKQS